MNLNLSKIKADLLAYIKEPRAVFQLAFILGVFFGLLSNVLSPLVFVVGYIVCYALVRIVFVERAQSYYENREQLLKMIEEENSQDTP